MNTYVLSLHPWAISRLSRSRPAWLRKLSDMYKDNLQVWINLRDAYWSYNVAVPNDGEGRCQWLKGWAILQLPEIKAGRPSCFWHQMVITSFYLSVSLNICFPSHFQQQQQVCTRGYKLCNVEMFAELPLHSASCEGSDLTATGEDPESSIPMVFHRDWDRKTYFSIASFNLTFADTCSDWHQVISLT